ncbi:MAG: polysaccharide biosynthesis C-terminal domain-containing protein [Vicinamibacterales bacterium]
MIRSLVPGRRMARDTAWNFAALGVTAGVGGIITLLIAGRMGPAALGVFAQLYAVHVIGAQAAAFGIHDSTQKHVAEYAWKGAADDAIIAAGVTMVALLGLAAGGLLTAGAAALASLAGSSDVRSGLYLVAPGIMFFALNKVLFGALNGRGLLRRYAVMQFLRAALVLIAAAVITRGDLPVHAVGAIFTAAELALLPCLLAAVRPGFRIPAAAMGEWCRRHFAFGGRGLVNGVLLEAHLRVDVIALSYFVPDRAVGIYAFAMLFAEAIYQVPVVIRTVAYPTLVQLASRGDRAALARTTRRLSLVGGGTCAMAAVAVAMSYPLIAARFDPAFLLGVSVLQILLIGMTVYAFFVPFDQLLLQSGLPGRQSVMMALYVATNVILNILLIPEYGLAGAAIATALALAAAGVMLLAASWLWLGYRGSVLLYRAPAA